MSICLQSCSISLVFFVSMIYFTIFKMEEKTEKLRHFENLLSISQKETYEKIKNERMSIYFTGYTLGFFFSLVLILYYRNVSKTKLSKINILCLVFSVSFITNYFYYMLSPKTTYMLLHLNTKEQTKAWLEIYKSMQYNYHMGFVLGIIALLFLTHGTC